MSEIDQLKSLLSVVLMPVGMLVAIAGLSWLERCTRRTIRYALTSITGLDRGQTDSLKPLSA